MKKILLLVFVCLSACESKLKIVRELNCDPTSYSNLEKVEDFKKLFTVEFPDHWKTNLYYDSLQSSVYTADTTRQLTETFLIDITHVDSKLILDDEGIQKFEESIKNQGFVTSDSYQFIFQDLPSFYTRAKGKKRGFTYEVCNLFIQTGDAKYVHVKTEVYGDSLVDQRICNAFSLIEKIKINE